MRNHRKNHDTSIKEIRCPRFFCCFILSLSFIPRTAYAATFTVSTEEELHAAIEAANDESAHPGQDIIRMTASIDLTEPADSPYFLPPITSDILIEGGAGHVLRVVEPQYPEHPLFKIETQGSLDLDGVHLTATPDYTFATAIENYGYLRFGDSKLSHFNQSGIVNHGRIWIINSTITQGRGAIKNYGTASSPPAR